MAEVADKNPLPVKMVSFTQHDLPGLDAGEYELSFNQVVNDSGGTAISTNEMEMSYTFAVIGDRFFLKNPNDTVYSVFPAAKASGEYSNVLPHVVFNKTTLPWMRYPTIDLPYDDAPEPGSSTDGDVPTWMTVILLDEDDVADFPSLKLPAQSGTINDLFLTDVSSGSSLADNYSYFNDVTETPSDYLEPGETLTDTIQYLDIPLALFYKIAPTVEDLKLMAHVREVSLENKATMAGISDIGKDTGTFSIVFGNRLPSAGKKSYAYLVSLEQLENFLPTDEDGGAPNSDYEATKNLRLAVLKSWTFFATAETATFVDRMEALNGVETVGEQATYTNLCLPFENIQNTQLSNALSMGYAPMNYQLRNNENSVAFYRGPFVPYSIDEARVSIPISSPDRASIFDPTTGMLDISYSTAWTLGRLMALQSSTFSTQIYNWKKKLSQQLLNEIENAILEKQYHFLIVPKDEAAESKEKTKRSRRELLNVDCDKKWMVRTVRALKNEKTN